MDPVSEAEASFEFGRFRILPQRREAFADGRPIKLGGRAFDVLVALLEANGAVVTKDELMSRVWRGRIVEDNNLHAQIKALRKTFSDQNLVRTVVGRGYQFGGEVRARSASRSEGTEPTTAPEISGPLRASTNLPAPTSDLIGRDAEIAEVTRAVRVPVSRELIGRTSEAGAGKTRCGGTVVARRSANSTLPQNRSRPRDGKEQAVAGARSSLTARTASRYELVVALRLNKPAFATLTSR
jgi:DNA-binding winged helix-turn-helix (wHTH) protein